MVDLNAFYIRTAGILARPSATLQSDGVPAPPWPVAAREHLVPLLIVSACLFVAITFVFGLPSAVRELNLGLGSILLQAVVTVIVDFLTVLILARVAAGIASALGTETSFDRAFVLLALAMTPMILGRAFTYMPLIGLFVVPASLIYTFFLINRGAALILGMPDDRRLTFTIGMFLAMLVLSLVAAVFLGASTIRV